MPDIFRIVAGWLDADADRGSGAAGSPSAAAAAGGRRFESAWLATPLFACSTNVPSCLPRAMTAGSVLVMVHGYVKLTAVTAGGREVVLDVIGPGRRVRRAWGVDGASARRDRDGADAVLGAVDRRTRVPRGAGAVDRGDVLGDPPARAAAEQGDAANDRRAGTAGAGAAGQGAAATWRRCIRGRRRTGCRSAFRLSQRELGAMTGLIRESINKHLGLWREAGLAQPERDARSRCTMSLPCAGWRKINGSAEGGRDALLCGWPPGPFGYHTTGYTVAGGRACQAVTSARTLSVTVPIRSGLTAARSGCPAVRQWLM